MSNYVLHSHPFWIHFLYNPNIRDTAAHMDVNQPWFLYTFPQIHRFHRNVIWKAVLELFFCFVLHKHVICAWMVCVYSTVFFYFHVFTAFPFSVCVWRLSCVLVNQCCVYENTQSYTCTHAAVSFALLSLWMIYIQLLLCWVMVVIEWMNMLIMLSLGYRLGAYYRDCDVLFVFVFSSFF